MVAIDLPGYGESDKPKHVDFYKMANLVDLFPEIIHSLGMKKKLFNYCSDEFAIIVFSRATSSSI